MSLKKALYKPAAWYKGILLPICESGQCSLREATILASVLAKVSVPVLHSAAAITKIAEMPYSGANSLFIRVLVNKKYSLPYAVVDTLVEVCPLCIHNTSPTHVCLTCIYITYIAFSSFPGRGEGTPGTVASEFIDICPTIQDDYNIWSEGGFETSIEETLSCHYD